MIDACDGNVTPFPQPSPRRRDRKAPPAVPEVAPLAIPPASGSPWSRRLLERLVLAEGPVDVDAACRAKLMDLTVRDDGQRRRLDAAGKLIDILQLWHASTTWGRGLTAEELREMVADPDELGRDVLQIVAVVPRRLYALTPAAERQVSRLLDALTGAMPDGREAQP